jgi:hypothetical protein
MKFSPDFHSKLFLFLHGSRWLKIEALFVLQRGLQSFNPYLKEVLHHRVVFFSCKKVFSSEFLFLGWSESLLFFVHLKGSNKSFKLLKKQFVLVLLNDNFKLKFCLTNLIEKVSFRKKNSHFFFPNIG